MAKYTFTVGEKLTAARTNNFCQEGEVVNTSLSTTAGEPGGAWEAWTPTPVNVTNTTATGRYLQIGKTVFFWARIELTGTSSVSGAIGLDLPVTAQTNVLSAQFDCHCVDTNLLRWYPALAIATTTTSLTVRAINAGSTYAYSVDTSSTIPFTWTDDDAIEVGGTYEAG